MNKSEKEHLCSKIDRIAALKLVKPKVNEPDFREYVIRAARNGGGLKLLALEKITKAVAGLSASSRYDLHLNLEQVIAPPPEFVRLATEAKHDGEFCNRKNAPLQAKLNDLKDRINLGLVKDPLAAIREAEGWKV